MPNPSTGVQKERRKKEERKKKKEERRNGVRFLVKRRRRRRKKLAVKEDGPQTSNVTVVAPTGNAYPETNVACDDSNVGGTMTPSQLSEAEGVLYATDAVQTPVSVFA